MNSFRRVVTKNKTSIFQHKEAIDNTLREQLAALRLLQPKTQIVDQKLEQRKQELLNEMHQESLQNNQTIDIIGFSNILAELTYLNKRKRLQLIEPSDEKPQESFKISEFHKENEREAEIYVQDDLLRKVEQIEHSIRLMQNQNNLMKEQLELYDEKQPKINLKEIENKQQLHFVLHYIGTIRKAMQLEKEWQTQKLEKLRYKTEQTTAVTEAELQELCGEEDRQMDLLLQYEETSDEINRIDEDISTKFHKIEECAELLEEFDDIDKLTLIFVMENPDDFELDEILQNVRLQLRQPQSRLQLAASLQEYIDRARFSGVSSRMKIFFKFHNNDLNGSINSLIKVYRTLQIQETTLRNRYQDLLVQKGQLINQLIFLNQLQFYELDEPEQSVPQIDESQHEMAQYLKNMQIRNLQSSKYFFVRIFTMLTTVLSRIMNSLYNIKEILKSCSSETFGHEFYLKWTYNKMFIQLQQVYHQLEKQYKIKLVAKDPSIRTSNQFLNAIYDHIEEKSLREKTIINQEQKYTLESILVELSAPSISKINLLINQDIFLQQFFTLKDLAQIVKTTSLPITESSLLQMIQIEGYEIAHMELRHSTQKLFRVIEEIIIECRTVRESTIQAKSLAKKYHIQDILDKHMNTYEYKVKEWKKEVLDNKIKQLENQFDEVSEAPTTPEINLKSSVITTSTHATTQQSKMTQSSHLSKESSILTPTSNTLRRYLNTVESQIPCKKTTLPNEPIFAHLHQMSRKIKNEKISTQTHLRTFTLQSIDSTTKQQSQCNIQLKFLPSLPSPSLHFNSIKSPRSNIYGRQIKKNQTIHSEPLVEMTKKKTASFSDVYGQSNKKLNDFFKQNFQKIK